MNPSTLQNRFDRLSWYYGLKEEYPSNVNVENYFFRSDCESIRWNELAAEIHQGPESEANAAASAAA